MPKLLDDGVRAALRALYAETDALLEGSSCELSIDCCIFGRTGREPYPTPVELALVLEAAARSPAPKKRALPIADERRCPMLGQDDRCRIYADRPFGCRTFFCEKRVGGPAKLPRKEIGELSRRIADLAARAFPRDPQPRPLVRGLADGPERLLRAR